MKNIGIIASGVLGATVLDSLLSQTRPFVVQAPKVSAFVGEWGMNLSLVMIPAIVFCLPGLSNKLPSINQRFALSVFATWFVLVEFRMHFNLPALRELVRQADDHRYDGVGLNAAILVMGWLPSLVATTIMFLLVPAVQHVLWGTDADSDLEPIGNSAIIEDEVT